MARNRKRKTDRSVASRPSDHMKAAVLEVVNEHRSLKSVANQFDIDRCRFV
jgi:hypothetical protein